MVLPEGHFIRRITVFSFDKSSEYCALTNLHWENNSNFDNYYFSNRIEILQPNLNYSSRLKRHGNIVTQIVNVSRCFKLFLYRSLNLWNEQYLALKEL